MSPTEQIIELPLGVIERGFYQPREYFNAEAMEATKRSIQEKGQKYPVIVRPILAGNPLFDASWGEIHYELADGERRFRCCKELGLATLKALIRDLSDEEMLDYTLTTNDSLPLNPIEKAMVFSRLAKEFKRSQADIAASFNLKQQQVSEYIRLLDLPAEIQDLTARAVISVRHARELLKIQDAEHMRALATEVSEKSLSTRELTKKMKESRKKTGNDSHKVTEHDLILDVSPAKTESKRQDVTHSAKESAELLLHDAAFADKQDAIQGEEQHFHGFSALERLHQQFLPRAWRDKLQYWLSFELGTTLGPEAWLIRLEGSLFLGILVALAAVWLPLAVLGALCGVLAALVVFLFVS
jgi:ParB family chromosome partitioning protein